MAELSRRARGFTLIEVLVALAIFAVAAVALLNTGRNQIQASSYLEEKTIAHWVGMNRVVEMQTSGAFPEPGRGEQRVSMGGREWKLMTQIDNTPVNSVRRLTVDVAIAPRDFGDDAPIVTSLTAFISRSPRAQTTTTQ